MNAWKKQPNPLHNLCRWLTEGESPINMTIVCDGCGDLTYPSNADDSECPESTHTCDVCKESMANCSECKRLWRTCDKCKEDY